MNAEIKRAIKNVDTTGWKEDSLEFGGGFLRISVPPDCVTVGMKDAPVLSDPRSAVQEALSRPIGCPGIEEIIAAKGKAVSRVSVAIAVSDITRPVPY
ncbi:MAG: DUF2088 domain-containing protein, partial [Candidatus Aminicenantes bacterium]|nr:DUF2088 domain-containing protein [Candidatus Aminicenantes bacterium]